MRRFIMVLMCLLTLPCLAGAGEQPRIPFAHSGSQLVADVDAVVAMLKPAPDLMESIRNAEADFTVARDKLLADLVEKFTAEVGKPEEVFAKLDDEKVSKDDKLALNAKIQRFAANNGQGYRSSVLLLEATAKREIGRALGKDETRFRTELNRRQALKSSMLGTYIIKLENAAALKLDAGQQKRFDALCAGLKASHEKLLNGYTTSFTEKMGNTDDLIRIRKEGTAEERAAVDKKVAGLRKELEAEMNKKSEEAVNDFEKAVKEFLKPDQQEAFAKLVK